jgi:hypothetical protein
MRVPKTNSSIATRISEANRSSVFRLRHRVAQPQGPAPGAPRRQQRLGAR